MRHTFGNTNKPESEINKIKKHKTTTKDLFLRTGGTQLIKDLLIPLSFHNFLIKLSVPCSIEVCML